MLIQHKTKENTDVDNSTQLHMSFFYHYVCIGEDYKHK